MGLNRMKQRMGARRRDSAKLGNYGAKLFHEVKRFDGKGNLIETISPNELMARPIGAGIYSGGKGKVGDRMQYNRRIASTNGEGSKKAWNSLATKVKKGSRVKFNKVKV